MRPASRLEVRPRPEMLLTGIAKIDALTGGIPRGCLSEIYGSPSSGKTSVLLAALASATQRDESCVLIDAGDSFDPDSGQAAGVEFGKLLWVRCGAGSAPARDLPHGDLPRSGRNSKAGDRRPAHDHPPKTTFPRDGERRLEQVLKTTDLILQSGGFGLVALDLAGIPEKFVRRIPLASWFRFQRAVEHAKTALLVVTEFCCAGSCATLILKCSAQFSAGFVEPEFGETGWINLCRSAPAHSQLLEKIHIASEVMRWRLERKPMQSVRTDFTTRAVRMR